MMTYYNSYDIFIRCSLACRVNLFCVYLCLTIFIKIINSVTFIDDIYFLDNKLYNTNKFWYRSFNFIRYIEHYWARSITEKVNLFINIKKFAIQYFCLCNYIKLPSIKKKNKNKNYK